jgi:hypothetical protein
MLDGGALIVPSCLLFPESRRLRLLRVQHYALCLACYDNMRIRLD